MHVSSFLADMRAGSAYPVFRGAVGFVTWLFYAVAAVSAVLAVGASFSSPGLAGAGIFAAIAGVLFLVGKLFREAALMLADMADAMIQLAANQHPSDKRSS
jgi:hypothetical protein